MTASAKKVALVTGANQGLGLALVAGLCRAFGEGGVVYLTARDLARGHEAAESLRAGGLAPRVEQLDVRDEASVAGLAATIRGRHGGLDVVISNAAARMTKEAAPRDEVDVFVDTNNHGTYRILRAFAPLLRDAGRLVVVASSFGSLRRLDPKLHARFDAPGLTLEDIEHAMDDYADAVKAGRAAADGWPDWINIPSKIGQVASVRILARDMAAEARRRGILINAACPGLIDTAASRPWFKDMSKAASPDEAAVDVVWLATLPAGTAAPYGELVRHREILPWR